MNDLRTFLRSVMEQSTDTSARHMERVRQAKTEEERNRLWQENTNESMRHSLARNSEYDRRFKGDSIVLRDELAARLHISPDKRTASLYEHPTNPIGMEMVAADLEVMAKRLHE